MRRRRGRLENGKWEKWKVEEARVFGLEGRREIEKKGSDGDGR